MIFSPLIFALSQHSSWPDESKGKLGKEPKAYKEIWGL